MNDLTSVEKKLRESGLLDGLEDATPSEAAVLAESHRLWAARLAPYLLFDGEGEVDVATALRLYRLDNESAPHTR